MSKYSLLSRIKFNSLFGCPKCSIRYGVDGPVTKRFLSWNLQTPIISRGFANNYSPPNEKHNFTPPLMKNPLPMKIVPEMFRSLRNTFFAYLIIPGFFDKEFNLTLFDKGARQAVSIISNKLAKGEYEDLEGLVEPSVLAEVKESLSNFTVAQREALAINIDDITVSFPFEVGVIMPDEPKTHFLEGQGEVQSQNKKQTRHVEITMVFHVYKGRTALKEETPADTPFMEIIAKRRQSLVICNYRFFRDFTEGPESSWIVNMINHFAPSQR